MINPFIIDLKSLSQPIKDCIIGAGEVNGRHIVVIFTQELAERFTKYTKVYLSWKHKNVPNLEGYNVFSEVGDPADFDVCGNPPTWEIRLPQAMLEKGDVVARIEIVDEQSIDVSVNFLIKILDAPSNHDDFLETDTYSAFQTAVLNMNNIIDDYQTLVKTQDLLLEMMDDRIKNLEMHWSEHDLILKQLKEDINDIRDGLAQNEVDIIALQELLYEAEQNCKECCAEANKTAEQAVKTANKCMEEVNKIKSLFPVWEVLKARG